jgi:hypothetical protein
MVATDLEIDWPLFLPDVVLMILGFLLDMLLRAAHAPSALLIAGTVISLHVTIRDWPWRPYYLVPTVVCAIGAWLTVVDPALRTGGMPGAIRIPLTILLVPQLLTAVLDHRLLTRAMPENPDEAAACGANVASD